MSQPEGSVYDWYRRGMDLLERGDAAAAAQLLERAHAAEPDARHLREGLARALFDAGHFKRAVLHFRHLANVDPADDYAQFGLGLALWRSGELEAARESLAVAVALRPRDEYQAALHQVRATLAARD